MKYPLGYIEELDAVNISRSGEIGDIITISDLRIALPKKPRNDKILYSGKRKDKQYWIREEMPSGYNDDTFKSDKFKSYINSEIDKRDYGVWFMNNGTPEYITGAHWMLLQWCVTQSDYNGGYYYFSKAQQKLFLFWEAVWWDERSFGSIFEKIRRFGATDCALAFMYSRSIVYRRSKFGMTSKTNDDAKEIFERFVEMFKGMPPHFRPINRGESVTSLYFSEPIQKFSKDKKQTDKSDALSNKIDYKPTKESSYDGMKLKCYIMDEASKWDKANGNIINHYRNIKKVQSVGRKKVGKAIVLSTIEGVTGLDYSNDKSECGDKFKHLYYSSDIHNRNDNGETVSGLYKIFISSYEHYEGFIDKYGYPITENPEYPTETMDGSMTSIGIKTYIQNDLNAIADDPVAVNDYLRKTPIEESDGFRILSGDSVFKAAVIQTHITHNNMLTEDNFIVGDLAWENGEMFGNVKFIPNSATGSFKLYKKPPKELRNNYVMRDGLKNPANTHIFVGAVDPYRYGKVKSGGGSKGSIHIYSKTNGAGVEGEVFYLEYLKKGDVMLFWQNVIKAAFYFGCELLIENNQDGGLLKYMYDNGYTRYSMRRPDVPADKLSPSERKFGGIPNSSDKIIMAQALAIEKYIEDYIGKAKNDSLRPIDTFHPMPFNDTLSDWMSFSISDREKHDATISSGLALFAAQNRKIEDTRKVSNWGGFHKYFDNSGNVFRRR